MTSAAARLSWFLAGLSALFYVPSALSLPVNAVIGAAWIGLKTFPPPF